MNRQSSYKKAIASQHEEMCKSLNEKVPLQPASTKPNTTTTDTKLQQILKTLLIDTSFVAMVRKILSKEFLHTCHHVIC